MNKRIKFQPIKLSQKKGALLVEIMLTTALFSIVAITIASLLVLSGVMSRTNSIHGQLNADAMKILHFIGREIRETSANTRLEITDGGATVRFKIPIDEGDGDGFVIDSLEAGTKWGAYDQIGQTEQAAGNPVDRWVRYSVQLDAATNTNQLVRDVLDAGLNADPNLQTIVGNNIEAFNVALNNDNTLTITINLQASDSIGQSGTARPIDTDFSYSVFLRNAAN